MRGGRDRRHVEESQVLESVHGCHARSGGKGGSRLVGRTERVRQGERLDPAGARGGAGQRSAVDGDDNLQAGRFRAASGNASLMARNEGAAAAGAPPPRRDRWWLTSSSARCSTCPPGGRSRPSS